MVSKGFAGAVALIMALAPVAAFVPASFGVQKVRFDKLNLGCWVRIYLFRRRAFQRFDPSMCDMTMGKRFLLV
jgi:hypothetical protein